MKTGLYHLRLFLLCLQFQQTWRQGQQLVQIPAMASLPKPSDWPVPCDPISRLGARAGLSGVCASRLVRRAPNPASERRTRKQYTVAARARRRSLECSDERLALKIK